MVLKNARANTLSFQIVTTSSPQTFTLPLGSSASYTQDFTIDWGDGNSSVITAYDDPDKAHSYVTAGTYNLEIVGTCEYFGFNDAGDKTLLKRLNGLRGDIGLLYANFYGCSNLNYVDSTMNLWYTVTSFSACFRGCSSLTSIPSDLFNNTTLATNFERCFYNCTNLASIPSGLFDNNTLVTTFEDCFIYCSSITSIPSNLFDNNILVTTFEHCFNSCIGITAIPSGLFDNNTLVTTFETCFVGCTSITAIPSNLFDNNTLVTNFTSCFATCTSLTSIPSNLFDNNTLVTTFESCFASSSGITTIPSGLFDNNILVTTFESCFNSCTGITTIPPGLFDNNTLVTLFAFCFYDCVGINTDLPADLILYNIAIDDCKFMFDGCINMTGNGVPFVTTAEGHGVTTYVSCFGNCTSLTDYASIPAGWK